MMHVFIVTREWKSFIIPTNTKPSSVSHTHQLQVFVIMENTVHLHITSRRSALTWLANSSTIQTFTTFTTKRFGVPLLTALTRGKHAFMHTTGKILDENRNCLLIPIISAQIGTPQNQFQYTKMPVPKVWNASFLTGGMKRTTTQIITKRRNVQKKLKTIVLCATTCTASAGIKAKET